MNKKLIVLGSVGLFLSGLALTSTKALAYRGDPTIKGPNYTEERHQEMTTAFENNDFNSWKNLMNGKGRVTQVINEQNFSRFAEAHKLALEGKLEEAKQIRQELGLGLQNGLGRGGSEGFGRNTNR